MDMALTPEILVPRLGDYLVENGLLTTTQLNSALKQQEKERAQGKSIPIGQLLVEKGFITRTELDQAVTKQILMLQSRLKEANKSLERRVQERTEELEVAYQKLSELSELKANFVANISHELRTPLIHIKGYLDLFLSDQSLGLDDDTIRGLQVMQKSSERLEKLINDLIRFSTAETGNLSIQAKKFDLVRVSKQIIKDHAQFAQQKNIKLTLTCSDTWIYTDADKDRIQWVINQLVENAIKYTNNNGSVNLGLRLIEKFVSVIVEDTGIGFKPSQIDDIFEPFHQLDSSSRRKQGGTGLGLAIAKKIVEAHGSKFIVSSRPGEGSCFEFWLPVSSKSD